MKFLDLFKKKENTHGTFGRSGFADGTATAWREKWLMELERYVKRG